MSAGETVGSEGEGSRLSARRCPFPLASMSRTPVTAWVWGCCLAERTGGCSRVVVMVVGPFEDGWHVTCGGRGWDAARRKAEQERLRRQEQRLGYGECRSRGLCWKAGVPAGC